MKTYAQKILAAEDLVAPSVSAALAEAAQNSSISLQREDVARVTAGVVDAVAPLVQHATNNEAWYQSRVTLGALLAALSGILGLFGLALPDELRGDLVELIVTAGPVVGGAIALYGRWRAKRPIGS